VTEPLVLTTDGRDLDPRLADASGIGAGQRAQPDHPDRPIPGAGEDVWQPRRKGRDRPGRDRPVATYYDQPVVKAPPWGRQVGAYVVAGGVAGTAAALAGAVDLLAPEQLRPVARVAAPLAFAAGSMGAGLLLSDLGRPERMLNFFRVFRPTSVMNVGGYLLAGTTGAAAVSTVLAGRPGALGVVGRSVGIAGGVLGIPLAGYTGVLLSSTALPGWNIGESTLPPLFLSSGAATTGSLLRLAPIGAGGQATVGVMTVAAQTGELVAGVAHDRAMSDRPVVRSCYEAAPGWRIGPWLTGASLAMGLLPTRHTTAGRVAAGVLGVAGSVLTKMAVFDAGMASAADPRAVPESAP
jgi:formate-dependent nitrite reductase membrane component NrfD